MYVCGMSEHRGNELGYASRVHASNETQNGLKMGWCFCGCWVR